MKPLDSGVLGLFPSMGDVGGVERSGREAWRAIAEVSGANHHLICYRPPNPGRENHEAGESDESIHRTSTQSGSVVLAASRRWPVRLVLVWHVGMLKLLPFIRTTGSRTVLFLHGIEAWRSFRFPVSALLRKVDLFLTNSDFTWETFLSFHPELRGAAHCTVPLGLDSPVDANSVAEPSDPPTALMIGRVNRNESYKGHDIVIAAWSRVLEHLPGAKLRMIGPSEMTEELTSVAAKHGVLEAISMTGTVTESEKRQYLTECRCMALPSRGEGFGLAYIESMRMGRPCVVSTLDAGREVVCAENGSGPAGLAVDPANRDEVAAALVRLMTPGPDWERWSAASRQRYAACYTGEHFRNRLIASLGRLA